MFALTYPDKGFEFPCLHCFNSTLRGNHFSGPIPREFGSLAKLELLDLRENNLNGEIPAEITRMESLKRLMSAVLMKAKKNLRIQLLTRSMSKDMVEENEVSSDITNRPFKNKLKIQMLHWKDQTGPVQYLFLSQFLMKMMLSHVRIKSTPGELSSNDEKKYKALKRATKREIAQGA